MVRRIREIEILLGDGSLEPRPSEVDIITQVRRSIVAGHDLAAGQRIAETDIAWVRPGGGLAPGSEHAVIGKTLNKALGKGEQIRTEHLQDS